jgi:hypothetical protein
VETDLAAVAVGMLAAAVTGTATSFGQEAGATVVQVVRERLGATARGQTALAELEASPGDPEARGDAAAVLREEVDNDPDFRRTLSLHLNASVNAPVLHGDGNVVITGRVSRSPITLGPVTVNKPNTVGGLVALLAVVALVLALALYGGIRVVTGNDSPGGSGSGRTDSPSEEKYSAAVEALGKNMPAGWSTPWEEDPSGVPDGFPQCDTVDLTDQWPAARQSGLALGKSWGQGTEGVSTMLEMFNSDTSAENRLVTSAASDRQCWKGNFVSLSEPLGDSYFAMNYPNAAAIGIRVGRTNIWVTSSGQLPDAPALDAAKKLVSAAKNF